MAYIDRHAPQNRGPILAAIAVIHVGLAYALVAGLTNVIPLLDKDPPTEAFPIPLPQPTPEDTEQGDRPRDRQQPRPDQPPSGPLIPEPYAPPLGDPFVPTGGTAGGGTLPPLDLDPLPLPPPQPSFTPKPARPIGKPALWVTANDYPANDLRAGNEGTTRFRLSIGADGRAQSCEVTISSGYAALDRAACANVMKRSKFSTATDASGGSVPGIYSSAVVWKIPKD